MKPVNRPRQAGLWVLFLFLFACCFNPVQAREQGQAIGRKSIHPLAMAGTKQVKGSSPEQVQYLPMIRNDVDYESWIGIVNLGETDATVTITYYGPDGTELGREDGIVLPGMARHYAQVSGEGLSGIFWATVTSTEPISCYLNMISTNRDQSMFVRAVRYGESLLYVPHIAANTQVWNTYSSVVNTAADGDATPFFDYVSGTTAMNGPEKPRSQYWFEWVDDLFQGTLPDGMNFWGKLMDPSGPKLAAMEMFTRKDAGVQQLAGLELLPDTSNTLYFSHIAVNTGYWWTGIAVENVSAEPCELTLTPYDASGNPLTPVTWSLNPREKLVKVAQDFWAEKELTFPEGIAWVRADAEGGRLIGYELFGTLADQGARLLAGLNAPSRGFKALLFPHVQGGADFWTGIAVVNVGTAGTPLTVEAYGADGKLLATETITDNLPVNGKYVKVASDILSGGLPDGTVSMVFRSDQPLVGFELWGNSTPRQDYMSGMLAEPLPPVVFADRFEAEDPIYDEGANPNGRWTLLQIDDNQWNAYGWDLASLLTFQNGSSYRDLYPQTVPGGNDYLLGFYGSESELNHQILVSPVIDLPATATTVRFWSQFGFRDYITVPDALMVTEDLVIGAGWSLDQATILYSPSVTDIKSMPLSAEPGVADADGGFTRWVPVEVDISAYAGKRVRFIFAISSLYEESWHIDNFEVR